MSLCVTELGKKQGTTYESGRTEDATIRCKFVFNTSDKGLKKRLLGETELNLLKVMDICRAS